MSGWFVTCWTIIIYAGTEVLEYLVQTKKDGNCHDDNSDQPQHDHAANQVMIHSMSGWFVTCWTIIIYAGTEGWPASSCPLVCKPADSVMSIGGST